MVTNVVEENIKGNFGAKSYVSLKIKILASKDMYRKYKKKMQYASYPHSLPFSSLKPFSIQLPRFIILQQNKRVFFRLTFHSLLRARPAAQLFCGPAVGGPDTGWEGAEKWPLRVEDRGMF